MAKKIYSEFWHRETNHIFSIDRHYTIEEEQKLQQLSNQEILALGWKYERQLNQVEIEAISEELSDSNE